MEINEQKLSDRSNYKKMEWLPPEMNEKYIPR